MVKTLHEELKWSTVPDLFVIPSTELILGVHIWRRLCESMVKEKVDVEATNVPKHAPDSWRLGSWLNVLFGVVGKPMSY